MELLKTFVLLILGFVALIKGADAFVRGASATAQRFKVPTLIIGLTLVAMGTSAPELAVSVTAALKKSNDLALSNVLGSSIFNLMVVCGACALLAPIKTKDSFLRMDFRLSIAVTMMLLGFCMVKSDISVIDGIVLLSVFVTYMFSLVVRVKGNGDAERTLEPTIGVGISLLYIVLGIIAIIMGGNLVVDSASEIALAFGMSENLVGLTIVAVGTSLPELVTSITAAKKGETDMALGNAIGSNIMNILLILGLSSALSPITVSMTNIIDIAILITFSVIVFAFAWRGRDINKIEGGIMVTAYIGYIIYACVR